MNISDLIILLLVFIILVLLYNKFYGHEDFAKLKKRKKNKNKKKAKKSKEKKGLDKSYQVVVYENQSIRQINNPNMPYNNGSLPGLNKYIDMVWANGSYSNRYEAPAITVLLPYSNSHYFPYGNNWETSWWLYGQQNDVLIVQFDKPRFVSNVQALNWANYSNENAGYLEVYDCTNFISNQIINPTSLGIININNERKELGSLNVQREIKVMMFLRKGVNGWSKLENIIIN